MSFNKKYLDVAQKACDAERLGEWEQAASYWSLAIDLAIGRNRGWASARYEYCRACFGLRPVIIRERY